jgi:hypothetical protein
MKVKFNGNKLWACWVHNLKAQIHVLCHNFSLGFAIKVFGKTRQVTLGLNIQVAWTKWSERHLHTKWKLCGSWEERLSRSQVEFSLGIWKLKIEISKVLPILESIWKLKIDFFIVFQFFKVSWVKTYLNQETSDDWKSLNASYIFQPTSMV